MGMHSVQDTERAAPPVQEVPTMKSLSCLCTKTQKFPAVGPDPLS